MLGKKFIVMSSIFLFLSGGAGTVAAGTTVTPHDAEYLKAREQLADVLASEDFEMVEFAASSFEEAMDLIYVAVDSCLEQTIPQVGDVELSRQYGIDVLQGLNEHKVHFADDDGYNLVGERRLLISGEEDAKNLGEVLARVTLLIRSGKVGPGISTQKAARRIFEGMLPAQGTGQPLVNQYLVHLRMMSNADRRELLKHALK